MEEKYQQAVTLSLKVPVKDVTKNYLFQICFSQFTFFFISGINLKQRAN